MEIKKIILICLVVLLLIVAAKQLFFENSENFAKISFFTRKKEKITSIKQIYEKLELIKKKQRQSKEQLTTIKNNQIKYLQNLKKENFDLQENEQAIQDYQKQLTLYQNQNTNIISSTSAILQDQNSQIFYQKEEIDKLNAQINQLSQIIQDLKSIQSSQSDILVQLNEFDQQVFEQQKDQIQQQINQIYQQQEEISQIYLQIQQQQRDIFYIQSQFQQNTVQIPTQVTLKNIPVNSQFQQKMYNSPNCPEFKTLIDKYNEDLKDTGMFDYNYDVIFEINGDGSNYLDNTKILFSKNGRSCLYFYKKFQYSAEQKKEFIVGNVYLILRTNLATPFQPSQSDICYILNQTTTRIYADSSKAFSFSPILIATKRVHEVFDIFSSEKKEIKTFTKLFYNYGSFIVAVLSVNNNKIDVINLGRKNNSRVTLGDGIQPQTITQQQLDDLDYERDYAKYFDEIKTDWKKFISIDKSPQENSAQKIFFDQFRTSREFQNYSKNDYGHQIVPGGNCFQNHIFYYIDSTMLSLTEFQQKDKFREIYGNSLPKEKFILNNFGHMEVQAGEQTALQQGYYFNKFLQSEIPFVFSYQRTKLKNSFTEQSQNENIVPKNMWGFSNLIEKFKGFDSSIHFEYYYSNEIEYTTKHFQHILLSMNQEYGFKTEFFYNENSLIPRNAGFLLYKIERNKPIYESNTIVESWDMYKEFEVIKPQNKNYLLKFLNNMQIRYYTVNSTNTIFNLSTGFYTKQFFDAKGDPIITQEQDSGIFNQKDKYTDLIEGIQEWELRISDQGQLIHVRRKKSFFYKEPDSEIQRILVVLDKQPGQFNENLSFNVKTLKTQKQFCNLSILKKEKNNYKNQKF